MPGSSAWRKPDGYSIPEAWLGTLALIGTGQADAAEIFSGCHTWTDAWRGAGLNCATYDIVDDEENEDCRTECGQATLFSRASLVREKGVVMMAPKCSNFVFLNMGTSGRRKDRPEGDESRVDVRESNATAAMLCSLCRWLTMRGVYWVIEQPLNSFFFKLPVVVKMLKYLGALRTSFPMQLFGARSRKQTELWGTAPWLGCVANVTPTKQEDPGSQLAVQRGRWTHGNLRELRASQAYPAGFGARMLHLHQLFLAALAALGLISEKGLAHEVVENIVSHIHGSTAASRAIIVNRSARGYTKGGRQLRLPCIFNPRNRVIADEQVHTAEHLADTAEPLVEDPPSELELVASDTETDAARNDGQTSAASSMGTTLRSWDALSTFPAAQPDLELAIVPVSPAVDGDTTELQPRCRQYSFLENLGFA